jgi:hypothetical protein
MREDYNSKKLKEEKVYPAPANISQKTLSLSTREFIADYTERNFLEMEKYFARINSRRLIDIV